MTQAKISTNKPHPSRLIAAFTASFATFVILFCLWGRWRMERSMQEEAKISASQYSLDPRDRKPLEWLFYQTARVRHGQTLSSTDLDQVLECLAYSIDVPFEAVPVVAFGVLSQNTHPYDEGAKTRILHSVAALLDKPDTPRDEQKLAMYLSTLAHLGDSRADRYFERYRNDTRLLVRRVIAARNKRGALRG